MARTSGRAPAAILGLGVVLAVASAAAAVLQPSPSSPPDGGQASGVGAAAPSDPSSVGLEATPEPSTGVSTRPQAELNAIASEAAATPEIPAGSPGTQLALDPWHFLSGTGEGGPGYRSLADLGERSEAIVVGSFTGEVEPGRVPCDAESVTNGTPRSQACVFFVNLPFQIHEILAGNLSEPYRQSVKLAYPADSVGEVVPTEERLALFIGSRELRRAGIPDVYYGVGLGRGAFRDVDGGVVPLSLMDDPEFGRLAGMPFDQFIEILRQVPILELMPEG